MEKVKLKKLFYDIKNIVDCNKNYVPKDYQTIGGVWTVDTYQLNGVKFQVMDEGYTYRIFTDNVDIKYKEISKKIEFAKGTIEDLEGILTMLKLTGG